MKNNEIMHKEKALRTGLRFYTNTQDVIFNQIVKFCPCEGMMYLSMKGFFLLKNNLKIASLGGALMIHL